MASSLKHSKDGFNSLSYMISFKKIQQGYLMGSNGKVYQGAARKLVEDMIDGKKVVYFRAFNKGNQHFSTSGVNQIEAFRNKGLKNIANFAGKMGENAGNFLSMVSFMSGTLEKSNPDAMTMLDVAFGGLVGNPMVTLITGLSKTQISNDINGINQSIVHHLEESVTTQGIGATSSYLAMKKNELKVLEGYSVLRLTPTAMYSYLSGQTKDYKELIKLNENSPENETLSEGMLIKANDNNIEVKTIFLSEKK